MSAGDESHGSSRGWRIAGVVFALALAAWCYAPALRAYFITDDFTLLALVRLLREPLLVFTHDHFPGSLYFRPLGVLVWWLVCAGAEAAPRAQYALNLLLHVACVAALYTLLQRLRRDAPLNALWAALYAAHPLSLGTALWLSDRFDLLDSLFSLLALTAAFAYTQRPRAALLWTILLCLLLALMSKELGVVAAAAVFAAIAFAPRARLGSRQRIAALSAIAALTLAWLVYRQMLLAPAGVAAAQVPPLPDFIKGGWQWLRLGGEFLAQDPRVPLWGEVLLAMAALLWLSAAMIGRARLRVESAVIAALAVLIFLPGLAQAPIALAAGDLDASQSWLYLIVPSRFYHLSVAGLICALMLLTTARTFDAESTVRPRAQRLSAAGLLLALIALAPAAHNAAHRYAAETRAQVPFYAALSTAVAGLDLPAQACQVYLLQTSALLGFSGYADAIAKGLAAAPERLAHCLIGSQRPTYTYFVGAGAVAAADYRPLHTLVRDGREVPWITLGNLQMIYLRMGDATAIPAQAIFLDYRDGAFVDVSAAVRAGERKVDFVTTD